MSLDVQSIADYIVLKGFLNGNMFSFVGKNFIVTKRHSECSRYLLSPIFEVIICIPFQVGVGINLAEILNSL